MYRISGDNRVGFEEIRHEMDECKCTRPFWAFSTFLGME